MRYEPTDRISESRHKEILIAVFSAAGIALHLAFRLTETPPAVRALPLYATLIFGGIPLLHDIARKLLALDFGSDALAGISIVCSVIMGQPLVAVILVLMLSGGGAIERYATGRASSVLQALARRMPRTGHRKRAETLEDVELEHIIPGDILAVLPHEICPVDGTVLEGRGTMDEAYLTGEPYEMPKIPGSSVISGAINGESVLTIRAEKLAKDSRYAGIMRVMEMAERDRPRLRRLGDQLAAWYTPLALSLAAGAWVFSGESVRFLSVLVIATPCPLLIAIPVAVVGAISLAARQGIIIRSPAALEQIMQCRTMIFDKTGTLTYGKPLLTEVLCAPDNAVREHLFSDVVSEGGDETERQKILRLAASLERYSKHPLAAAVLDAAQERKLALFEASDVIEKPGSGLRGIVEGRKIQITGRGSRDMVGMNLPPPAPGLECIVLIDGTLAATFRFRDAPRRESHSFIAHLPLSHRVTKLMLVSGDRESEVRYLAEAVGIKDVAAGKSPEEKLAIVTQESRDAKTLFVGDGINDTPSLLAATVGVAIGTNSDVTSEAADAVIMSGSLAKVDELIHIGRRMRSIALQSALGGMALSGLGMLAAAGGRLTPIQGAVLQEFIDLAAVLNAVRVGMTTDELTDF